MFYNTYNWLCNTAYHKKMKNDFAVQAKTMLFPVDCERKAQKKKKT
jgi:hypothetical protein